MTTFLSIFSLIKGYRGQKKAKKKKICGEGMHEILAVKDERKPQRKKKLVDWVTIGIQTNAAANMFHQKLQSLRKFKFLEKN